MRKFVLSIITLFSLQLGYSQCVVNAFPVTSVMNCDDSIRIDLNAFADFAFVCDFNNGVCQGWAATSSAQINSTCVPQLIPDTPDNSDYLWMGNLADVPRELETNPVDVALGGQICFDLIMAVQGGGCNNAEGPDLSEEGVSFQYSLNGGITWIDIAYFQPDGTILPSNPGPGGPNAAGQTPFTQWNNYCFPIPIGAFSTSTSFQWSQNASSTTNFDHWGLDDVEIFVADTTYDYYGDDWGQLDTNFAIVYPTSDSLFTFYYTNGIDDTCFNTQLIEVNPTDAGPDIIAACDGIGVQLDVEGVSPWSDVTWTPVAGLDDPTSPTPWVNPVDDQIYVVTSNCGFDSILVDVVPTYDIDIALPDTICIGGSAELVTSITSVTPVTIASYDWSPSGTLSASNTANVFASPNTSTGYTVTATSDDNCIREATEVVYVNDDAIFLNIIGDNQLICQGDTASVQINADPPVANVPYVLVDIPFEFLDAPDPSQVLPINLANDAVQNLTLPFTFNFFGNNVNNATLSSNGWMSFTPAGNSDNTSDPIPTLTGVDNMIAFAWDDLDPSSGGTISAYILGTSPNQAFVLEFVDVPHLNGTETVSVQVVLFQSSGIIQINNLEIESDGFAMQMTQGIENIIGSAGMSIPGHNQENFIANMESWQFIPYNPPANINYTWDASPFLQEITGDNVNLFPIDDMSFTVTASDGECEAVAMPFVDIDLFEVLASEDTLICVGDTAALTGSIAGAPLVCTEEYDINSVPLATIPNVNSFNVNLGDDQVSPAIPLPFPFEFYCNTYNEYRISSNGFITFGSSTNSGCCSGPFLPGGGDPNDVIALFWVDLNPNNGGTISHWVTGTAPNRIYVTEFNAIPHFGSGGSPATVQAHMYETSNVVEIHCVTCVTDGSSVTLGLENANGTVAHVPAGRNSQAFSTNNEAWRFTPGNSLGNYTFDWTPNMNISDTVFADANVFPTTSQYYYLSATNINGCTYQDSTEIDFTSGIVTGDATICEGDTTQLIGAGATSYLWSPDNGSLTDINNAAPFAFPSTTTTYTVTFDPNSCPTTGQVTVTVNAAPVGTINDGSGQEAICDGTVLGLGVTPNNAAWMYDWTGPETGSGASFNVSTPGLYTLTIEDDNGCIGTSTVNVTSNPNAALDFSSLRNVLCCTDDEVSIVFDNNTVPNGVNIASFTVDGVTETEPFVISSGTGTQTFDIEVTTDEGCVTAGTFEAVTNCINPNINDIGQLFINTATPFLLDVDNGTNYTWTVDAAGNGTFDNDMIEDPTYTPTMDGSYLATAEVEAIYMLNDSSEYSCFETDTATFTVISITEPVFPDAFSPNGDNLNETFFDVSTLPNNNTIGSFKIYNRWGEIVYNYNNEPLGWDGKFQNELQPNDVYIYMITIIKADNTETNYTGNITLIR